MKEPASDAWSISRTRRPYDIIPKREEHYIHKRNHMSDARGSPSKANPDHAVAGKPAESSHKRHKLIVAAFLFVLLAALALTLPDVFPAKPAGMVWIPGGEFQMGDGDAIFPDARPVHKVHVNGFWMDRTEVTNAQFARFVEATDYVT